MMDIVILGPGCYNCEALERTVFDALAELDVAASVVVVRDATKIAEYKVSGVPALLVNGNVKVYGRVPRKEEIKKIIADEQ
jgi:small redox-active disulfide protein 2